VADYDKLIPPADVLKAELDHRIEEKVRTAITERILREAGYEQQVAETLKVIKRPTAATLAKGIAELFERERDREWRDHIEAVADRASE
jgi:hypothetical protein